MKRRDFLRAAFLFESRNADADENPLSAHVDAAIEHTADQHASQIERELPDEHQLAGTDSSDGDADTPEDAAAAHVDLAVRTALRQETLFEELDDVAPDEPESVTEVLADQLRELPTSFDGVDYDAIAAEFCAALERKATSDRASEANTLNALGNAAGLQGDYDRAREYHERSLAIRQELGNRTGEAETQNNLAKDYQLLGEYDQARDHFRKALELVEELGEVDHEMQVRLHLALACQDAGDEEAAIEWAERGLDRIAEVDDSSADEYKPRFEQLRAQFTAEPASLTDRYRDALAGILRGNPQQALAEFQTIWNNREDVDPSDDEFDVIVASGVAVAAFASLFEQLRTVLELDEVLADLEDHRDCLSPAPSAVLAHVEGTEPAATATATATADELVAGIDDPDQFDLEDGPLGELETLGFAHLVERLARTTLLEEGDPDTLYRHGLTALLEDDPGSATKFFGRAWDSAEEGTTKEPPTAVLGAGVGLAALLLLAPPGATDRSPADVTPAILPHRERLSESAAVLYEALVSDTDVEPEDLLDGREEPGKVDQAADLIDLEAVAFAGLLGQVTGA